MCQGVAVTNWGSLPRRGEEVAAARETTMSTDQVKASQGSPASRPTSLWAKQLSQFGFG
jgi:hypothetical protein